jgi:CxxC-x17-CxxC domain-containing protein
LVCADCGGAFEFSVEEQEQFTARGFASPKRCRSCRAAKRRRQTPENRTNGVRSRHAEPPPAPRPREPKQMHAATCTVCGEGTEVPFQPDGLRPVYCLPCLKQRTR